ncbi:MAG: hypothetical protein NUV57_01720, partial [archaeon]|nr:hypothetical protein [archaeon]
FVIVLRVKESQEELGSGMCRIIARIFLEKGRAIKTSVSLVCEINGKQKCVLRYDCAHGFLHKDLCYKRPPEKEVIQEELSGEFVWKTINYLRKNHEKYKKYYERNYGEEK